MIDFEPWYQIQHPRLLATMVLFIGDGEIARDATDEAFVRSLQHWQRVRAMESPSGWLYTVARNIALRRARRVTHERALWRLWANGREFSVPAAAGEAWLLVANLTPRQREAVVLRYVADLPEPEIATIMGVSRATVSSTLRDAKRRLRSELETDIGDAQVGREE